MIVLGLNHGEINSSAALVQDGRVIAGAPEERFSRQKLTKAFPRGAIEYCLKAAGIDLAGCDFIAQGWNPGAGWTVFNPLYSGTSIRREDNFYAIPDNLYALGKRTPGDWVLMTSSDVAHMPPIYHVQH